MSSLSWSGFTEDDLRKIREDNGYTSSDSDNGDPSSPRPQPTSPRAKQVTFGSMANKKSVAKKSLLRSPSHKFAADYHESMLDQSETLSPPKDASRGETCEAKQARLKKNHANANSSENPQTLSPINGKAVVKLRVKSDGHSVEVLESRKKAPAKSKLRQPEKDADARVREVTFEALGHEDSSEQHSEVHMKKKITLEEFQIRQRMIEEQNKLRRAMLSKAISDRKKKTQAETEKLTHIQVELQKLDSLVSNDVAILRDQIEVASMEFNEVQKRYEKAEREFIEAKTDLFRKMERKEQLTEYLCTIIEENEMRKARKLADLMHELALESLIEEYHHQEAPPVLPQLCAFNDSAYKCCTTLRDPNAAPSSPEDHGDSAVEAVSPPPPPTSEAEPMDQPGSCTESADELPETNAKEEDGGVSPANGVVECGNPALECGQRTAENGDASK